MMSEYENPTITFYPHESEFDVTPEEQKPALSTNERLMNYNGRLKESLNNGIRFTEVFDTLINTTDLNELFQSIKTLASYQLDDDYLVYPIQYSRADFYLIFINRLLSLNDKETVILMSSEKDRALYHEFPGINACGRFKFKVDPADEQRAFYIDERTGLSLFYIDFSDKVLYFNSRDIVELPIANDAENDKEDLIRFEKYLVSIGECVEQAYGYEVDFNLLNARRNAVYPIVSETEPEVALDRLFIMGSEAGCMLKSGMNGEAIMNLSDSVVLTLFDENLAGGNSPKWVITVKDDEDKISFFDLLVRYDFFKDWYLENLQSVEIRRARCFWKEDDGKA